MYWRRLYGLITARDHGFGTKSDENQALKTASLSSYDHCNGFRNIRNTLIILTANRYCLYKREENSRDQTRRSKRSRGLNKNSKWTRCYLPGATNLVILLVRVVYLTVDKFSVMLL